MYIKVHESMLDNILVIDNEDFENFSFIDNIIDKKTDLMLNYKGEYEKIIYTDVVYDNVYNIIKDGQLYNKTKYIECFMFVNCKNFKKITFVDNFEEIYQKNYSNTFKGYIFVNCPNFNVELFANEIYTKVKSYTKGISYPLSTFINLYSSDNFKIYYKYNHYDFANIFSKFNEIEKKLEKCIEKNDELKKENESLKILITKKNIEVNETLSEKKNK